MTEKVGHESGSTYIEMVEETRSKTNVVNAPTVSLQEIKKRMKCVDVKPY